MVWCGSILHFGAIGFRASFIVSPHDEIGLSGWRGTGAMRVTMRGCAASIGPG
ncbi:hypothetical protein [Sphingomonas sp.]|jgi:hypothetical protein|uniref:hypothetical protein n=1 Tax=Sphingomonas sp. TaxID=28214 RepID=UPI000AE6A2C5